MAKQKQSKIPLPAPMTITEYDAMVKGETVQEYDPVKTKKTARPAVNRSIPGPFPRPVAEGETFTRTELLQQGLDVVYKHARAVIQLRK